MPQAPNPTPVPQDTPRTASDEPTIAHDDPDPTAQTSKRDATGPLAAIGGYLLIDRRINGAQEDRLWPHLYTDRAEAYADAKAYPGSREEALASGWTNTEGWTSRTEVIPVTKAFAENYAAIPLERFDSFESLYSYTREAADFQGVLLPALPSELGAERGGLSLSTTRTSDTDPEDEARRRAGRSGGGAGFTPNPAHATHSLNIRPDVVSSPAGLEVITTMKSADYRVQQPALDSTPPVGRDPPSDAKELTAEEKRAAMFAAIRTDREAKAGAVRDHAGRPSNNLEENVVVAPEPSAVPDQPDPCAAQQEEIIARANEESTKRQEAERAARSGEEPPSDSKGLTAEERQADMFAAIRAEREAAKSDAHDDAGSREQGGEGRASPGTGGGRGVF